MIIVIFLFLSYLIEVSLKYYLPFLTKFYTYLEPMFFVSFLIIYIIFYYKQSKSLYFVLGSSFIYDFLFGNILFLYTFIFLILYYIISFICRKIHRYLFIDVIIFIGSLILFLFLKYLILLWVGYNYSIIFLLDQILYSIIINLVYGIIIYLFLGIKLRKA